MEFKKCARCGCFFISESDICCNCQPKDNFEIVKLRNYLELNDVNDSMEALAINTGISEKNLNRYLNNWGE